jgi:hypothetical protein
MRCVAQRKYAFSVDRRRGSSGSCASSIACAKQICARSSISMCSPLPECILVTIVSSPMDALFLATRGVEDRLRHGSAELRAS